MLKSLIVIPVLLAALFLGMPPAVRAAPHGVTFTVNTIADEPDAKPGDGKCKSKPSKLCTLRAAVMETNALAGKDKIMLPATAAPYQLTYTGPYNDNARTGDLDIIDDLVIQGGGAANTIINGYASDRIFHILSGKVKISKVQITNGSAAGNFNPGGGINVDAGAKLALVKSTVQGSTSWLGGGVYNAGQTTLKRSVIQENSVTGFGGGIVNAASGTLNLFAVTVTRNSATADGGGIRNNGTLFISASTLSHNTAQNGGGIAQTSALSTVLVNSTVANNTASNQGGGIYSTGTLSLFHVSIGNNQINTAGYGSGAGIFQALTGTTHLWNTLLDWNTVALSTPPFFRIGDCEGVLTSHDYNFLSSTDNCAISGTTTHDQYNGPAYSGFLGSNGGPTQTIPLPFDSPAVDAIPVANCKGPNGLQLVPLTRDQRSVSRPRDGDNDGTTNCDIGAFER